MRSDPGDPPEDAIREILAWLHQAAPDRLLLVCPPDSALRRAVDQAHGAAEHLAPDAATPAALDGHAYDLAVVAGTLECLTSADAGKLLSRLRDLHTKRFLALVRLTPGGWSNTDLIAYGMKRCGRFEDGYALYRFNIYDYKDTPDWLNARYWAHPERWGKERW